MPVRLVSSVAQPPVPPPPHRPQLRVVSSTPSPEPSATHTVPRACDGPMAFLLDDPWPEYADLVHHHALPGDTLGLPVQSLGPMRGPTWPTPSGARIHAFSLIGHLRKQELAAQSIPAARVRTRQKYDGLLARAYAGILTPGIGHLLVTQDLLPHLWEAGVLRRRTFDVLMTRLPCVELNARVRAAQARHPTNAMLYLHVTDSTLTDLETEALRAARRVFTPHAEVAERFGHRAVRLPWVLPPARVGSGEGGVLYPGAVHALEGAYEVRATARATGLPIGIVGAEAAHAGFWRGVPVYARPELGWLSEGAVVVQPAWVLSQPRRLLEAVAAGIRVVSTEACGLPASSLAHVVRMDSRTDVADALHALGALPRHAG